MEITHAHARYRPGPILSRRLVLEIIIRVILLSSADSTRSVVSYKRMYVQKVPVNYLVKLATSVESVGLVA